MWKQNLGEIASKPIPYLFTGTSAASSSTSMPNTVVGTVETMNTDTNKKRTGNSDTCKTTAQAKNKAA